MIRIGHLLILLRGGGMLIIHRLPVLHSRRVHRLIIGPLHG